MRERFISTLLDLLTAIGLYIYIFFFRKLTYIYIYIYVNLRKNNTQKISRIFRTECQHACAEKTHILLYLFAKGTACTPKKNHLGLLLDLSAKDTALELMYINMHVRETFGTDSYPLVLKIRLTYRDHALIECRTLDKGC